jgi:NADPH2:quinone reductase
MTGFTAWHLLHTMARVQPGDTILVHAAAGGVGLMLSQLAKRSGVTVLARWALTTRSPPPNALG